MFAGTCWHLRRLDWCEEVGEPLMDEVSVCQYSEQYLLPIGTFDFFPLSSSFLFLKKHVCLFKVHKLKSRDEVDSKSTLYTQNLSVV